MSIVTAENALTYLTSHQVEFECIEHPAVHTGADMAAFGLHFPGQDTKHLFLVEEKGARVFLATVPLQIRVSLKLLAAELGVKRLTFGSPELMVSRIGITPGSVTPLALCNDVEKTVECIVDEEVWNAEKVQIHPMRNTATLVLGQVQFRKILELSGHGVRVIKNTKMV